jgi:hypothetical protein
LLWPLSVSLYRACGRKLPASRCGDGGYKAKLARARVDLDFTLDQLPSQAQGFLARRLQVIKMKVSRDVLEPDIDRVSVMLDSPGFDALESHRHTT